MPPSLEAIIAATVTVVATVVLRVVSVVFHIKRARRRASIKYAKNETLQSMGGCNMRRLKTCAVLGSGGHTTEMIQLISSLSSSHYTPMSFVVAKTDTTSVMRLEQLSSSSKIFTSYKIYRIPRAREVGQSYVSSVFTTLHSLFFSVTLVFFRIRPDLFICNGPGTCLPLAILIFILRLFRSESFPKIIFIESFCRVKTLSLTGLVLFKLGICDLFCVHWPELVEKYDSPGQGDIILLSSFIEHEKFSKS